MNSRQPLYNTSTTSEGYSRTTVTQEKPSVFAKDIRSFKSFRCSEWFLLVSTITTLLVTVALFCVFVEQQFEHFKTDWVFLSMNFVGYLRFGFIIYYCIYGILNEESFSMIALAGSLVLQLMLASYYNVLNHQDDYGFSFTVHAVFNACTLITSITIVASLVLTCKYWTSSLYLFVNIYDLYMERWEIDSAMERSRLVVKNLLIFEIQWSFLCLSVVFQQWRETAWINSVVMTTGLVLILIRAFAFWFLIGKPAWKRVRFFVTVFGFALVPSVFVYFHIVLVEDPRCIPLTVSALFLIVFISLNHILLFVITGATSPSSDYVDAAQTSWPTSKFFYSSCSRDSRDQQRTTAAST